MPDGSQDGIGFVALTALEIISGEPAVRLHVADHGTGGGASPEFLFNLADHTPLLA